jgi:hypothetical protein
MVIWLRLRKKILAINAMTIAELNKLDNFELFCYFIAILPDNDKLVFKKIESVYRCRRVEGYQEA